MIFKIIQQVLGIILFFLSGVLLSYIIERKTDIIKRAVYSITLAPCISVILGILLYYLNLLTAINIILILIFLNILFLLIILNSNEKHKTKFNKDLLYLIFFSIIGTLWRLRFLKSIKNLNDPYAYAFKFFGKTIPNLGFYTGMTIDHSRFIGINIFSKISKFLLIDSFLNFFGGFLITFLFLGFIYLIFPVYRSKKLALIGIALMSFGPIEIFHTTTDFFGHSFSYITLLSLFLLYKSKNKKYFLIPLLLSVIMIFTYVTSTMINTLTSIGFIIALSSKDLIKNRNIKNLFKNKKILVFVLIMIISLSFVFGSYSLKLNSSKRINSSNTELITKHITSYSIMKYKDPTFLGLSAIRWQMIFFFLCGLTFIFYIIRKIIGKKDLSKKDSDLLLCLIPILIVSSAFFYVNLPTRIFNYFAFFGLLSLKIPKKYLKIFFILSFIFILITGFYVAQDKKIFFETSDKEIKGALWINESLKGKIFSDQAFVNQLILNNYYNVTGAYDDNIIVYNLFYQNNSSIFLNTTDTLNKNLGVDYIVLTKRMIEKYILMVNVPQKPLNNINLYEENLEKIYDNGDIKVFKITK